MKVKCKVKCSKGRVQGGVQVRGTVQGGVQSRQGERSVSNHASGACGPRADLSCLRQGSAPGPQKEEVREKSFVRRWVPTKKT